MRRVGARRDAERESLYVDAYRPRDLVLLVSVFLLNVLDAAFTLTWVREGGAERNPLMDRLLQSSEATFLNVKLFTAGVAFVWLMAHKNFRVARFGLWALLGIYTALLAYHVWLRVFLGA